MGKPNPRIQTVAELRTKELFNIFFAISALSIATEANGVGVHRVRARVARHNQSDIAKISLSAVVVRKSGVVHHLE